MDKTGGNTDYIAKLFGNIRGRNAFDALSSSLDKYKQALNGLKNSRGVTDEIFGEKMSDPYMQWTISVNKFKESIQSCFIVLYAFLLSFCTIHKYFFQVFIF